MHRTFLTISGDFLRRQFDSIEKAIEWIDERDRESELSEALRGTSLSSPPASVSAPPTPFATAVSPSQPLALAALLSNPVPSVLDSPLGMMEFGPEEEEEDGGEERTEEGKGKEKEAVALKELKELRESDRGPLQRGRRASDPVYCYSPLSAARGTAAAGCRVGKPKQRLVAARVKHALPHCRLQRRQLLFSLVVASEDEEKVAKRVRERERDAAEWMQGMFHNEISSTGGPTRTEGGVATKCKEMGYDEIGGEGDYSVDDSVEDEEL